ncbi:MAG: App1 family protein [Gemmatimonadota bacterium]
MDWQRALGKIAVRAEDRVDRARGAVYRSLGRERPVRIAAYRGYGTRRLVHVRGRVLYGHAPPPATPGDRWWVNLVHALRRLESDEVAGARVRVRCCGGEAEGTADEEGHFRVTLRPDHVPGRRFWHEATVELVEPRGRPARAFVAIPRAPRFGVISDLDDTVLHTGVRNLLRMGRDVLFGNAHTRIPFPGVGAFYRALHTAGNPVFYVSSSPWNLYDVLSQFLHLHRIPAGPMELRDWGISADELIPLGHHSHKRGAIERILRTYPELSFILVGDSGQEDPEIYRELVHDHPDRVLAIYIRSVVRDTRRIRSIEALAHELAPHAIDLVLVDDTIDAARHACERGWIEPAAIDQVAKDQAREEAEARG